MANRRSKAVSALLALSLAFAVSQLNAQDLYRYKDSNGVTILNSSVPAEYVNAGYEVLDSRGIVIEVVPEIPDAPEVVVSKSDALLVTSFSSVRDIEGRRDRILTDIQMEIDNIRSDNRTLRTHLAEATGDRDHLLRVQKERGLNAPQETKLNELQATVKKLSETAIKLQKQLQERSRSLVVVNNDFALKIERFMQLKQSQVDVRAAFVQNPTGVEAE